MAAMMTVAEYAKHLDMALHLQSLPEADIRAAAREARAADVAAFYTNPYWTPAVVEELAGSDVRAGVGIAFPYGCTKTAIKFAEIDEALADGATAVDMVVNIGALKDKDHALVEREIAGLRDRCEGRALTKLIFEVGFLDDAEIVTLTRMCCDAGLDYVKTATGTQAFPSEHHVRLMRASITGDRTRLKVSGVPRQFTLAATLWMFDMGVDLVGTRSAAKLVEQYREHLVEKQST
jgi:deoxyribose-phosphate aldolase